jgi:hypothetical protein
MNKEGVNSLAFFLNENRWIYEQKIMQSKYEIWDWKKIVWYTETLDIV